MWAWLLPETQRPVCFGVQEPFGLLLSDLEDTAVVTVMEPLLRGPDCGLGSQAGYVLSFRDNVSGPWTVDCGLWAARVHPTLDHTHPPDLEISLGSMGVPNSPVTEAPSFCL